MREWNRAEIKRDGKAALRRDYWAMTVLSMLAAVLAMLPEINFTSSVPDEVVQQLQNTPLGSIADLASQMGGEVTLTYGRPLSLGLSLLGIFVFAVLNAGISHYFAQAHTDGRSEGVNAIGVCFREGYINSVLILFLRNLFILLWSLLLIIPGIVKAYQYRMVPYILADNPNLDYNEVFARSKEMTNGNKGKMFVMDLSFLGWMILGIFTLGLVIVFWVQPYYQSSYGRLYVELKGQGTWKETL